MSLKLGTLKTAVKTLILLIMLVMASCSFKKESKKDIENQEKAAQKAKEMIIADGGLKEKETVVVTERTNVLVDKNIPKISAVPKIEPMEDPGHYKVTFKWGADEGSYDYTVNVESNYYRASFNQNTHSSSKSNSVKELYFIFNEPGEKRIRFDYYDRASNVHIVDDLLTVTIPADLVLPQPNAIGDKAASKSQVVASFNFNTRANNKNNYNRVFLKKDFKWLVNSNELKFYADSAIIIEEGAEIRSFTEDNRINLNGPGQSGGSLYLSAPKVVGKLILDLRGQDGGNGTSGRPWTEKAASGMDGIAGESRLQRGEPVCAHPDRSCTGSAPVAVCTRQPTNGQAGQDGADGRAGQDGFAGGVGGAFEIVVNQSSDFELLYNNRGGKGGTGGEGSLGQVGGVGGAAGARDQYNVCDVAKAGANGKVGSRGKDGAKGADGKNGSVDKNANVLYKANSLVVP